MHDDEERWVLTSPMSLHVRHGGVASTRDAAIDLVDPGLEDLVWVHTADGETLIGYLSAADADADSVDGRRQPGTRPELAAYVVRRA